jgi:4-hydroxy-tetrahydrodipicolinate reductase
MLSGDVVLVGLHGSSGRMGQSILQASESTPGIMISHCYSKSSSGQDLDMMLRNCDVIIDFSASDALPLLLAKALQHKRALVIGTTGISALMFSEIKIAAQQIPIFYSANMSLGVSLLAKIAKLAAGLLAQQEYDVDIIEIHHKQKKDAPSGTALMLGQEIAQARGQNLDEIKVFGNIDGKTRKTGDLHFSSIRSGADIGQHKIMFTSKDEALSFEHKVYSRHLFATGALRAAKWMHRKPSGFYSMDNLHDS